MKPRPVVAPRTLGTVFTSEASTIALAGDDARAAKLAVGCALSHAVPEMDYGVSSELLYHVYNWLQFQVLLPGAKADMLSLLARIEEAVESDDRDVLLDAGRSAPDIGLFYLWYTLRPHPRKSMMAVFLSGRSRMTELEGGTWLWVRI